MVAQPHISRTVLYSWVDQRRDGKLPEISKYLLSRLPEKEMSTDKDPWLELTPLEQITALENERAQLYLKQPLSQAERARIKEITSSLPNLWDLHRRGKAALKVHPAKRQLLPKKLVNENQVYTGQELDHRRGVRPPGSGTQRYCPNCECKRNTLKVKSQDKTYECKYCGHTFTQE